MTLVCCWWRQDQREHLSADGIMNRRKSSKGGKTHCTAQLSGTAAAVGGVTVWRWLEAEGAVVVVVVTHKRFICGAFRLAPAVGDSSNCINRCIGMTECATAGMICPALKPVATFLLVTSFLQG